MYQDFFGFSEMPFNVTPDPRFLYLSPTHEEALVHLHYGIEQKKGFVALTGEVGCGKTTLCRKLLNELNPQKFDVALILNPYTNRVQLLRDILNELGEKNIPESNSDLVNKIHQILLNRSEKNKSVILIIDEAQNLPFDVLEQIRLLSNLETDDQKLLQIILIGQPELKYKLKNPKLRQLKQRILVYFELKPLSLFQTRKYINHRLSLSNSNNKPFFTSWATRKLYNYSHGVPRIINNICDKSLLSAFTKAATKVKYNDVCRAIDEIKII